MDDKKQMQNEELDHVSGGSASPSSDLTRCSNCWTYFKFRTAECRNVKDGCSAYYVYKCPNCGKWVESGGKVYNG